jgi:acetolactate synthase-1/2/3 large subunit
LKAVAEYASIPFSTAGLARGIVPEDHPLALGMIGARTADVILALGVRFDYTLSYGRGPVICDAAKVIQVNSSAEKIGFNRGADLGIVGGCRAVLEQLLEEMEKNYPARRQSDWVGRLTAKAGAFEQFYKTTYFSDAAPIHPARLAREVSEFIGGDAKTTLVLDGGDCATWMLFYFKAGRAGQILSTGPFGCLGLGTGFSMAAQLANPGQRVILYSGDGSFGLNCMEFDTFLRYNLPIVAVISNDGAWGMIKHAQKSMFGEAGVIATDLVWGQRYDKVVEALGGHGEFVTRAEEVKPALERAFASGKPAVVNCVVDQDNFSHYTKKLLEEF